MSTSTLSKIITQENIRKTWRSFWKESSSQRSCGVDGLTPKGFKANEERNLARLRRQLVAGYVFSSLRGHPVPKKDGVTHRIICVPTVDDRVIQRMLAEYLTRQADRLGIINEVSYGFIPSINGRKRGVQAARDQAIALRVQHGWAYKSDISSFFDRIPRSDLISKTIGVLRVRSLRPLLTAAASCEIEDTPAITRIAEQNGIVRGQGVRQGMPLSPLFANIILRDFDSKMINLGKRMVRYADDFIIFADSKEQCLEVDCLVRRQLGKLGFKLPPLGEEGSKTYIANPDEDIEFLGLALAPDGNGSYKLILTEKQIDKIKRNLYQLNNISQLLNMKINITDLGRVIENKIAGYQAAYRDAHNVDELNAILHKAPSLIMRNVYVKAFGEEKVQALDEPMRRFLGLEMR